MAEPMKIKVSGGPDIRSIKVAVNGQDISRHVRGIAFGGHIASGVVTCDLSLVYVNLDADLDALIKAKILTAETVEAIENVLDAAK